MTDSDEKTAMRANGRTAARPDAARGAPLRYSPGRRRESVAFEQGRGSVVYDYGRGSHVDRRRRILRERRGEVTPRGRGPGPAPAEAPAMAMSTVKKPAGVGRSTDMSRRRGRVYGEACRPGDAARRTGTQQSTGTTTGPVTSGRQQEGGAVQDGDGRSRRPDASRRT